MTTATTALDKRPLRLPRGAMVWVTWRQHRSALLLLTGVFVAIGIALLISGSKFHSDYHTHLAACRQFATGECGQYAGDLVGSMDGWQYAVFLLTFAPGLIGAFLGAPLLAREFETGSYRYTWTQGVGRTRWVASKMLLLALVVVVVTGAFTALFHWWDAPAAALQSRMRPNQFYEVDGLVFVARTLAAFSAGVFLGAVLRRTVPAMAATLAVHITLWYVTVYEIRRHLMTPVVQRYRFLGPGNGWRLDKWLVDPQGHRMSLDQWEKQYNQALHSGANMATWEKAHPYTVWAHYQPGSHFWSFQAIEGGGTLALALVFAAAALWWVRHRTA